MLKLLFFHFKILFFSFVKDEFVLDDDEVIVLTNVDIGTSNQDEADDSDAESLNEFYQYVSDLDLSDDDECEMDDFIDDRPESELSENSDNASGQDSEEDEEEDKEYDR